MEVAPIYCCWVFILLEYKTMKKSIGKEDMAKPFVNTKVQICWWCNPKCYSDPHEWSHDAFMMACMYCNTIEWCLVVGDLVVTPTWQPPHVIFYLYCHPHNCYSRCLGNIWRKNPLSRRNKQARNVVVLAIMHIVSHTCFKEYWVG